MGPENSKGKSLLLISSMIWALSLLTVSSFIFVYNFSRIFKMNKTKKRLIEIGSTFIIVCMIFDIVNMIGGLSLLRMKSCLQQDLLWPLVVLMFEVCCKYVPIYCFTSFFSTKLSLYSQN
jgi:Na+/proline symporter